MAFQKAERRQAKLKLLMTGPSGSGKTLSSLLIADGLIRSMKGVPGRIAVIDTENASASLYVGVAGVPEFDALSIEPPFSTEKYLLAVKEAIDAKYDCVIVDSLSHQWAGDGGILQRKERMDARPGSNSYTNWGTLTPEHEKLKSMILHSNIHMICTARSKQDYVLQTNDKGKQAPIKVGMAPIQRDQLEYEFTLVLDIDMSHQAVSSKDRTGLFDGKLFTPSAETGKTLWQWLSSGIEAPKATEQAKPPRSPFGKVWDRLVTELMLNENVAKQYIIRATGKKNSKDINAEDITKLNLAIDADRINLNPDADPPMDLEESAAEPAAEATPAQAEKPNVVPVAKPTEGGDDFAGFNGGAVSG